jgi:hypothetical protein
MKKFLSDTTMKYLQDADFCPFCGKLAIGWTSTEMQTTNKSIQQEVKCYYCQSTWVDHYTLTDVTPGFTKEKT